MYIYIYIYIYKCVFIYITLIYYSITRVSSEHLITLIFIIKFYIYIYIYIYICYVVYIGVYLYSYELSLGCARKIYTRIHAYILPCI